MTFGARNLEHKRKGKTMKMKKYEFTGETITIGNAQYRPAIERELQPTIVAKGPGAVAQDEAGYTVRRLTPTSVPVCRDSRTGGVPPSERTSRPKRILPSGGMFLKPTAP